MNIIFSELEKWEEKIVEKELNSHSLKFFKSAISTRNASKIKNAEVLGIFIHTKIDKKLLDRLPKLKLIIAMSVGFDHVDIEECRKRKISVSNVPDYGSNSVAEHAFGLLLTLTRKIHEAIEKTREEDFSVEGLMGTDLKEKNLGIVGVGRIGTEMIKIGRGFGMNIIALDRHPDKKLAEQLEFKYAKNLNELLKKSDVVSLHVPLLKETYHLINKKNIKLMKKGSYLINTARGGIVDVQALKIALDRGILAGAGLDVLEGEEDVRDERELLKKKIDKEILNDLICNHLLLKKHNVVITPHSAFYSEEAVKRILLTAIEIINCFNQGKEKNKIC